jgi:hypothetical protein
MPTLADMREVRRAAWRDRPTPPCQLSRPDQFDLEFRREELRDHRWKRRKDQIAVFVRVAGATGLVGGLTAAAQAWLG